MEPNGKMKINQGPILMQQIVSNNLLSLSKQEKKLLGLLTPIWATPLLQVSMRTIFRGSGKVFEA